MVSYNLSGQSMSDSFDFKNANHRRFQASIEIDIKGNLLFEEESVTHKELKEKLKNHDWKDNKTVIIIAETGTLFENVVKVMRICDKFKIRVILASE